MTRTVFAWITVLAVFLSAMPCEDLVPATASAAVQLPASDAADPSIEDDGTCPVEEDEDSCPDECACLCCPGHATVEFSPQFLLRAPQSIAIDSRPPHLLFTSLAVVRRTFRPPRPSWMPRAIPARAGPEPQAEKRAKRPLVGLASFRGSDEEYDKQTNTYGRTAYGSRHCGAITVFNGSSARERSQSNRSQQRT